MISVEKLEQEWKEFSFVAGGFYDGLGMDSNGYYCIGPVRHEHESNDQYMLSTEFWDIPVSKISWKSAKSKLDLGHGFRLFISGIEVVSTTKNQKPKQSSNER